MGRVTTAVLLATLLLAGGASSAQNPPPQTPPPQSQTLDPQRPVFRSATDMVRVDVIPRRRNRVVEGLTAQDFQVTEDGVRQTIETFEYIPIDLAAEMEPLDPRTPSEARRMAADPRNRVFVFYVDTYNINMEGAARTREPLLKFLQEEMGPRDLFAVMTPRQSPEFLEFTRLTQALATELTVSRPWGLLDSPHLEPNEYALEACQPGTNGRVGPLVRLNREVEVHMDLEELITRLGSLREERKNLIVISERWQAWWLSMQARGRGRNPAPAPAHFDAAAIGSQRGRGSFQPPPVADAIQKCNTARQYLTGFNFDRRARDLPMHARRNNVAIYFIPPAPRDLSNFDGFALHIAEETDGRSIVSNDIALNLREVMQHQTGFYMLGFRSTAGQAGAKPRTVRVRTSKDGVDLDVRRIYDPPPAEFLAAAAAPAPAVARTDVQKAIDRLPPQRDDEEVFLHAARRADAVDVTVEIAPRIAASSPWRDGSRVTVALRDEAGAPLGSADAAIAAGDRSARVTIALAAPPTGSLRASVQVAHAAGATLADGVTVEPPPAQGFGSPVLSRAGALPRLPYLPAAFLTFSRTERLRIDWPVTGALATPAARLLNANGESLAADIALTATDGPAPALRADLRLLSLAPGEYVLEVTAQIDGTAVKILQAIRVGR